MFDNNVLSNECAHPTYVWLVGTFICTQCGNEGQLFKQVIVLQHSDVCLVVTPLTFVSVIVHELLTYFIIKYLMLILYPCCSQSLVFVS